MADIILSNICKRFGEKTLFENFSLKIERGEFLSIMGESGAGKTTLLNMMGLLDRPDSGTVVLCGQKNPAFSSRTAVNLRRRHISYLFQNYGLIDTETVENNMRIATHFKRKVYTLSGGEQQRVALAKVIAKSPQIIFADEPTGSLDECNRDYVLEILQELNYQGKTIVVVTHDPHVNECAQRHIMLKAIQKSKEAEAYTRAMNTIRFSSEQKAHIIKCVADEKEQSNKS